MRRSWFRSIPLALAVLALEAAPASGEGKVPKSYDELLAAMDKAPADVKPEDYTRWHDEAIRMADDKKRRDAFDKKQGRCYDAWQKVREGLASMDEGVAQLTSDDNASAAQMAMNQFDNALGSFAVAQRDWKAGTPESCGDAEARRNFTWKVGGTKYIWPVGDWVEKVKQLQGLANERRDNDKIPDAAKIAAAPRASKAAAPGGIAPKYVDNPQYGCGSVEAWAKTVTKERPAGEPKQLPGCLDLDDEKEGGAKVQALTKAKQAAVKFDEENRGEDKEEEVQGMKEYLDRLTRALQGPAWKEADMEGAAGAFETVAAWAKNEHLASATRREIHNTIVNFADQYDAAKDTFSGGHHGGVMDHFIDKAQQCVDLIKKAQAAGVDLDRATFELDGEKRMTYRTGMKMCSLAKLGAQKRKKADEEAAAAEDAKWKTMCGGDKYEYWKRNGGPSLCRGCWAGASAEEACKKDQWWVYSGPDDNGIYECAKYTYKGNKQVSRVAKSNRWSKVCPP